MECSDDLIQQLLDCPHALCTHAYKLYWPSTHQAQPHYAQRDGGPNYGEWVERDVEWCGFTGIGFCKITPEVRVRPLIESPWQNLDCEVTKAIAGKWHIHWPGVEHYHR